MSFLCGLCLDGMKPYPSGCPECGEKPRAKSEKLWLWRDGERFLAFRSLYPTLPGSGDPAVLGQPCGYALFFPMTLEEAQAVSREQKRPVKAPMGIIERLGERTTLRYMGDCKCGKCQLVPSDLLAEAIDEIARLLAASPSPWREMESTLEEAAKVADQYKVSPDYSVRVAAEWIADDIRALKSEGLAEGPPEAEGRRTTPSPPSEGGDK